MSRYYRGRGIRSFTRLLALPEKPSSHKHCLLSYNPCVLESATKVEATAVVRVKPRIKAKTVVTGICLALMGLGFIAYEVFVGSTDEALKASYHER